MFGVEIPCLKYHPEHCFWDSASLVWDCFGVQMIIIQILSNFALRAMTGHEGESAVMLFGIFIQLLKLCGAILKFACSPKALPLD